MKTTSRSDKRRRHFLIAVTHGNAKVTLGNAFMSYAKLATSILTSTIWMEDDHTRLVWLTILAMKDRNGEVQASIPGLANQARVPIESARAAILKFLSPDPDSRTKQDEGRRLEVIDGGWHVINHEKYRDMDSDEDRKEKAAVRQRRFKERKAHELKENACGNAKVTQGNGKVTPVSTCREQMQRADSFQGHNKAIGAEAPIEEVPKSRIFKIPTLEELDFEAAKVGLPASEVDLFVNFYGSKGWVVGKTKMKSWPHALAGWAARWRSNNAKPGFGRAPAPHRNDFISMHPEHEFKDWSAKQHASNEPGAPPAF